jgi:hypothetical protein
LGSVFLAVGFWSGFSVAVVVLAGFFDLERFAADNVVDKMKADVDEDECSPRFSFDVFKGDDDDSPEACCARVDGSGVDFAR